MAVGFESEPGVAGWAVAFEVVVERLADLAERDGEFRDGVRSLLGVALERLDRPREDWASQESNPVNSAGTSEWEVVAGQEGDPEEDRCRAEPKGRDGSVHVEEASPSALLPRLTLGQRKSMAFGEHRPMAGGPAREVTDEDLSPIERRCRMKAEGARWAAERMRLRAAGASFRDEIKPRDDEIIRRAKEVQDCFLWMCTPQAPTPDDPARWEELADCFQLTADSVALVRTVIEDLDEHRESFKGVLTLLAGFQSAVRVAVERLGVQPDPDQDKLFLWLLSTTERSQVYVTQYMTLDNPAEPTDLEPLEVRQEVLSKGLSERCELIRRRRKRLNKITYHLKLIKGGDPTEHNWEKVIESIDLMVREGIPASSPMIRQLLLPVVDDLPDLDEYPRGFRLVLREIDAYLSNLALPDVEVRHEEPTAEVRQVARLLEGRKVVLIGGSRRPHAQEALRSALSLGDLEWIGTREHESIERFRPSIAHPDVAVVLLAIRWSSHSFGDIKEDCDRHGKPLVRLPGGYSPNQVAAQVLSQCGERLRGG